MIATDSKPYAVIDIGSNSVRLVVYHALVRVPMPVFNEKYYCGLARQISETGHLHPEGKKLARRAIARFAVMLERFQVEAACVIATAAIRDAKDGAAFITELEQDFLLQIDTIDGLREAELAALGVIASFDRSDGLCADLGGGSLEIAEIQNGIIRQRCSLPLGTLRLATIEKKRDIARVIAKQLQSVTWLGQQPQPCCVAIGGSFRNLAKMHMRAQQYPLRLVHEYGVKQTEILRLSDQLSELSPKEIAALPGVSDKRADTLPYAAELLAQLMRLTDSPEIRFSVAGIREGLLYERLTPKARKNDPLYASAEVLSRIAGRRGRYANELYEWMHPLFPEDGPQQDRLRQAFCLVSEIAWTIDPNFRAEWSYLRILQSDMKGMSHAERVTLALAMYHRHQIRLKKEMPELVLLSPERRIWAKILGLAGNLAFHLSGGLPGHLPQSALTIRHNQPTLQLAEEAKPLLTETVEKRLEGLGSAFNALSSNRK